VTPTQEDGATYPAGTVVFRPDPGSFYCEVEGQYFWPILQASHHLFSVFQYLRRAKGYCTFLSNVFNMKGNTRENEKEQPRGNN
jgi:hypothetical protein